MLIRCKIERENGSVIELDGKSYHFKPAWPGGPHVAEVPVKAHIGKLLGITEGYEPAEGFDEDDEDDADSDTRDDDANQEPTDEDDDDGAEGDGDGEGDTDAPVQPSEDDFTLSDEGYEALNAVLTDPDGATDDDVQTAFNALNGRFPRSNAKRETIIDRITEKAKERGFID